MPVGGVRFSDAAADNNSYRHPARARAAFIIVFKSLFRTLGDGLFATIIIIIITVATKSRTRRESVRVCVCTYIRIKHTLYYKYKTWFFVVIQTAARRLLRGYPPTRTARAIIQRRYNGARESVVVRRKKKKSPVKSVRYQRATTAYRVTGCKRQAFLGSTYVQKEKKNTLERKIPSLIRRAILYVMKTLDFFRSGNLVYVERFRRFLVFFFLLFYVCSSHNCL